MAVHDMLMAAGGVSTGPVNYIDDVFATHLYTGNSSTQTINNGIDLATEGGMVWLKSRSNAHNAHIYDTERGTTTAIYPAATNGNTTESQGLQSFSTTGFSLGAATDINSDPESLVSWTFRKKAKFFDIVTYSGTGSARTIAHNLGSKPGFIIIKKTSSSDAWVMWHRGLTSADYYLRFNTFAETLLTTMWNSTEPTSSVFSVGTRSEVNANGSNYIAYIFAHDAGGFGAAGTDNVISCGTINGASTIDLGYEPQFIMVKRIDASGDYWYMNDSMRGLPASFSNKYFCILIYPIPL